MRWNNYQGDKYQTMDNPHYECIQVLLQLGKLTLYWKVKETHASIPLLQFPSFVTTSPRGHTHETVLNLEASLETMQV